MAARHFLASILAVPAFVACATTGRVETGFAPSVPVLSIYVDGTKQPRKSKERDARLELAGKEYEARIKIRGNSSTLYPKKQFGLKLKDGDSKLEAGLLGMAPASSWVLGSPYADKTLIKNVLGLAQARQLFPYAPQTRWVEVILNGQY